MNLNTFQNDRFVGETKSYNKFYIFILFMSSFVNAKKRRQQSVMSNRLKQVRGVAKPIV